MNIDVFPRRGGGNKKTSHSGLPTFIHLDGRGDVERLAIRIDSPTVFKIQDLENIRKKAFGDAEFDDSGESQNVVIFTSFDVISSITKGQRPDILAAILSELKLREIKA